MVGGINIQSGLGNIMDENYMFTSGINFIRF